MGERSPEEVSEYFQSTLGMGEVSNDLERWRVSDSTEVGYAIVETKACNREVGL